MEPTPTGPERDSVASFRSHAFLGDTSFFTRSPRKEKVNRDCENISLNPSFIASGKGY
jgi:hypothetical protein